MDQEQNTQKTQTIIVKSPKNVGLAAGLGFFFGPIGMFLVNIVVGLLTLGFGFIFTFPICAVWAYIAAKKYNQQLYAEHG